MKRKAGRWWLALTGYAGAALTVSACGGSGRGAECRADAWQGQCVLRTLTTVRTVERFPRSYVVVEGLYEPAPGSAPGAPVEIRKEFTAEALQEADLKSYLQQNANAPCSVQLPRGAACEQAVRDFAVAPYQGAPTTLAQTSVEGCALIEKTGLAPNAAAGQSIPDDFPFDEGTAAPSSAAQQAVDRLAHQMQSDPRIQCVALSGQNSFGEDFALSDQRARAIQKLLLQRGIEPHRVTVFAAVLPTYAGTSAQERQVVAKDRNVRATIVIYAKE
jgi:outer membrane protein OmpA-like peptidoglycan-associated protein